MIILTMVLGLSFPTEEFVAATELNHLYSERDGKHVLDQFIFYDSQGYVIDYKIVKSLEQKRTGHRTFKSNGYSHINFYDKSIHTYRFITTTGIRETWTQHDPELEDRRINGTDLRRKLRKNNEFRHILSKQEG